VDILQRFRLNTRVWLCLKFLHTFNFKKGYQHGTKIVKDEKHYLVADSHSIMARWKDRFSQLLNVHGVNDVRQTEIGVHTTKSLVPLRLRWLLRS
jgi:hypothetical protein